MSEDAKTTLEKADQLFEHEKYEAALKQYNIVLKADPDNIPAIVSKDMACLHLKKTNPATQKFLDRNNMDPLTLYIMAARMFSDAKMHTKAIDALSIMAAIFQDNHLVYHNLGIAFDAHYSDSMDEKLLDEAMQCYDQALEIKPDFTDAAHNKALILQQLQRFDQAIKHCDKVLKSCPNDPTMLELKGATLNIMHEYKKAIRCHNMALKAKPDSIPVRYNKAVTLYHLGRMEESLDMLDEAGRIDPNLANYANLRENLVIQLGFNTMSEYKSYSGR